MLQRQWCETEYEGSSRPEDLLKDVEADAVPDFAPARSDDGVDDAVAVGKVEQVVARGTSTVHASHRLGRGVVRAYKSLRSASMVSWREPLNEPETLV